jgi:hypothetical protein
MTNTLSIIRALLIYGLCLPLAVYLGYLLAMPLDRGSLMFLAAAILLPLIPILLRWHHVLLVTSWNMSVVLFFLPGSPYLWIVMTAVSLGLTVLQHILRRNVTFTSVPSVTLPLLFLTLVVLITAKLTGGIGIRSLGGEAYGGKRYVMILAAIAGYFALTSHRVPPERAMVYVALYFLGSLTMIMGSIAPWMPSGMRYVYALFPVESLDAFSGREVSESVRLGGLAFGAAAACSYLLARHGMQGVFAIGERWRFLPFGFKGGLSINQPWRMLVFLAIVWVSLTGGFRSIPILLIMTLFFLFWLEGLFRTRLLPALILAGVLALAIGLPFVDKMPMLVQRSLSFLPIKVNPLVKITAESSTEWRLKIWREVIPTIPQYLLVGKGYSIDARELDAASNFAEFRAGDEESGFGAALASDYHNGPLSLLIPLGAFGMIAFLWFVVAGFRVLLNNFRHGDPQHRQINTFLLAYFLTKITFFFLVFGSFQNELMIYTGLVGLSAAINGGSRQPAKKVVTNPAYLPFRLPKAAKV